MMETPLYYNGKRHLPIPTGKYVVGATDIMTGPDIKEGSFLRLYYPCEVEDIYENSASWASWLPNEKYVEGYSSVKGILRALPYLGATIISYAFGNCYTPVVVDAVPTKDKIFPTVVFSHGLTACRTSYSMICSEIASQGFIVASVEHRDGSACMSYNLRKDEETNEYVEDWVPYEYMQPETNDLPLRLKQLKCRVRECQKSLDLLIKINDGTAIEQLLLSTVDLKKFKGLMDLSQPVIAGHSFGSATVLRTLAVEKRFKIGIALDAWMWPLQNELELPKLIEQPILFINMEGFQKPFYLEIMKRYIADNNKIERRVVTLKGSIHMNQVDVPFLLPWYVHRLAEASCAINHHVAMGLNNGLMLVYLQKHLGLPIDEDHLKYLEQHKDLTYEGIA